MDDPACPLRATFVDCRRGGMLVLRLALARKPAYVFITIRQSPIALLQLIFFRAAVQYNSRLENVFIGIFLGLGGLVRCRNAGLGKRRYPAGTAAATQADGSCVGRFPQAVCARLVPERKRSGRPDVDTTWAAQWCGFGGGSGRYLRTIGCVGCVRRRGRSGASFVTRDCRQGPDRSIDAVAATASTQAAGASIRCKRFCTNASGLSLCTPFRVRARQRWRDASCGAAGASPERAR